QVTIDLDDRQVVQPLQQRPGQGRQARTNLDDGVALPRRDAAHDGIEDAFVHQEVLPEPLACLMGHEAQRRWRFDWGSRRLSIYACPRNWLSQSSNAGSTRRWNKIWRACMRLNSFSISFVRRSIT